jgi:hypothetical protein
MTAVLTDFLTDPAEQVFPPFHLRMETPSFRNVVLFSEYQTKDKGQKLIPSPEFFRIGDYERCKLQFLRELVADACPTQCLKGEEGKLKQLERPQIRAKNVEALACNL